MSSNFFGYHQPLRTVMVIWLLFQICSLCIAQSKDELLGVLCETDNDNIGQHLGCNCKMDGRFNHTLKADCSDKWIEYNNTSNNLPLGMNISRHVQIVDLSRNYLKVVNEETFGLCEGVHTLILSQNQISIFEGVNCPRLIKLDLSWNKLKNLTAIAMSNLTHLLELDLSNNELLFLEPDTFEQLKNLRVLDLASNKLGMELFYQEEYMLSLQNLRKLEDLDLSNSSLPDFPESLIKGTTNLKRLRLRTNLITSIERGVFQDLGELVELDLSNNLFETIKSEQFLGLHKLRLLILDKTMTLKTIEPYAFAGLKHLREVSCQMNYHLFFIDSMAFRGDPETNSSDCHPKVVRLADNYLQYIDYPLLVWKDIEVLELHRNSWVCDCNLQWVSDFYKHKPHEAAILNDSSFNCFEPHIFAGVPIVAVNPEEMLCFSPAATVAGTIGIIVFAILLFSFCSVIVLNQMGMLPEWVRRYNVFGSGSSLPTYTRVNPKPSTKARRMVDRTQAIPELHCYSKGAQNMGKEPPTDDLEWDTGDIGRA